MPSLIHFTMAGLLVLAGIGHPRQVSAQASASMPDRERLIGAWHLVSLKTPGPDGKMIAVPGLKGTLIYTRDGHMSVEIMYPESQSSLTNDYVLNGYEASFGSYDVDESTHTITHHVQGSITRQLAGKNLVRSYQLSQHRLIVRSVLQDEHWSVTWEHD